jgi:hypothetical protein
MTIVALGIWVILLPHLGVPHLWLVVITTLTGLTIIAMGLYLRAKALGGNARRNSHSPYVENASSAAHDHPQEIHG